MQEARKRRSDLSDDALLEMVKTVHGLALQDLAPHSHDPALALAHCEPGQSGNPGGRPV